MTFPRSHAVTNFPRDGGLYPPPDVIRSWPKPNYVDPEERGWEASILLCVVMGITFLVYIARIWARLTLSKNAGLDDILIGVAILPLFGLTISTVLGIRIYGFQWHVWDQTSFTLVTGRKIAMAIQLSYVVATTLTRVSILFFYRRITGKLTCQFVYWVWGTIASCVVYGIVFIALMISTCSPVVGFFHIFDTTWRSQNELVCLNEGAIIVSSAVISTVQDVFICILPMFLVWNLQIGRRRKAGLCCLFGIGLITCVCGIMRTHHAVYLFYYTYDISWAAHNGWVWTNLEAQLSVICASLPALKVLFNRSYLAHTSKNGGSRSNEPSTGTSGSTPHNLESQRHFGNKSRVLAGGSLDSDIPFQDIKGNRGLGLRVHNTDCSSQKSFDSTCGLTGLPTQPGWTQKSDWNEGCRSVWQGLRPGSSHTWRDQSREEDVEVGRAV